MTREEATEIARDLVKHWPRISLSDEDAKPFAEAFLELLNDYERACWYDTSHTIGSDE